MISQQKKCVENIAKNCNKCKGKKEKSCLKNMKEIDGWW